MLALTAPAALYGEGRNIRFERISLKEGLSQATVTAILQDRIGFMWIGTQDGLNRFDGYDFVVYKQDPADPDTLANNWVQALLEDPSGDIWVGSRSGGLSRWQRQLDTFVNYPFDPENPAGLSSDQVWALHHDGTQEGVLWVGTDSGLDRFDVAAGRVVHYHHDPANDASLPHDQVWAILEDSRGRLWVATFGGLARFDREAGSFTRYRHDPADGASLADDRVRSILEDRSGNLWVGTYGGLDLFDPASGTFEHFRHDPGDPTSLSENLARLIYEDNAGRLWVGTDGGLNLLEPAAAGPPGRGRRATFTRYRHDPADDASLSKDRVIALYQDRGGVLWAGTQAGGISRWDPRTWSFSSLSVRPSDLSGRDVTGFTEDAEQRLWIGTSTQGLNRIERSSGAVTHFRHDPQDPNSLGGDRVVALLRDRRDVLWVGVLAAGLNRLDPGTETFVKYSHDAADPRSLSSNNLTTLFEDQAGTLWIGSFAGLNRLDDQDAGIFTRFRHDPDNPGSLSSDRTIALAEDREGYLWVATLGGGLNRFDRATRTARRFHHDPAITSSLSSDSVVSLKLDPAGNLWVGTQSGLNRLERIDEAGEAVFRRYFTADGLPNEFIYGIESDGGGGLWLSTNRGLSRLDPRSEKFQNYDTSHGLQADEFNFGAHYRSPSGELFFGGVEGFNAFFADRIELNKRVPPVVLTEFSVLNRPAVTDRPIFDLDRVELDYRDSIVSFEFAALDYTAPERNRYRYQLEGFSDDWIELGNRRLVSFTNLDAGKYTLRVQGSNNDGVWNEQGTEIWMAVAPPPWLTWWAYSLYALALAAVTFGFVRSQQRKVEREREVNRRLTEVDELRGELLANLKTVVEERTEQVAERERLLAEVEAKNAELERFNYTVSHDLKSPLVTIKGFLGMLERDAAAGKQERVRHDIRRIHAAADRMYQLLDELLHLSKMSHESTDPKAVQLDEVAREALEAVTGAVEERGAEIVIAPDLPVVMGDSVRLREVFQNLLANAVKYMGDQENPRVKVGMRWRGSETVFFVRDNGAGIDPRYHEKIFGLFERLETQEEGTGIGLALVKRIVEQHGGRIWVESEGGGRGSAFCFTLNQSAGAASEDGDETQAAGGAVVMASDRFRRGSSES